MAAPTRYVNVDTAQKVTDMKDLIEDKFDPKQTPSSSTSKQHTFQKNRSISMSSISSFRNFSATNTFDEERSSLKNTSVIFPKLDIKLDPDPEKAVDQICKLIKSDEQRVHENILGILQLPEPSMDQKLDLLAQALLRCDKQAAEDAKLQESFLNALAELSLFPKSHPLLCRVYQHLTEKGKLVEKIFALHVDRKLLSSLYSFISTDVKEQQPDDTLFRGQSLSAPLSGLFVRRHLATTLKAFLTKKLVVKNFDPLKVKQYGSLFEKRVKELLKELGKSVQLIGIVRKARIIPIREHFKGEKNLEALTRTGIIDMLFLRGICPFITTCEGVAPNLRVAFAKFLIHLVNGSTYLEPELQLLNGSLQKLTPIVEKFFKIL